jgi:hypothetical protein
MEFLHVDAGNVNSAVDSVRVNWYYRPRDVQRFSTDMRLVFSTMHSDMCPITSLRGKCTIKHRSEIEDLDAYRRERDSFYFVQCFDRFIRRSYECIPVAQIINVPDKVKKALDERWKFVVVEIGRVKELTSAAKTCKRCARYCASHDSVDCAICKNSYHMNCVQPPLPKKPSRGFAWACAPCGRASELKMEARNTPTLSAHEGEEGEAVVPEEQPAVSSDTTRAPSPNADDMVIDDHPATQAEIALAKMWPMRYLGIHARLEDALQYDDRAIYPRASSRLGPRHQANTNIWHGRPVELVKPADIKKRYNKGGSSKNPGKPTKETLAAIEADREERAKRPKWVQDEPPGYVARGEDYDNDDPRCTAKLIFKMPESDKKAADVSERDVDEYIARAKTMARTIGVPPFGVNFLDKSLELLAANKYSATPALEQLKKVDRQKDLHEPVITRSDLVKFEEGVAKYGSEHRSIRLHMKSSLPHADIVRFYYLWKKTPKGREIWGNYGGRKKRKIESDAGAKLQAEIAHDVDDSAFDNDKAAKKSRGFQCKFCNTTHSRQWRRAPGVSPGQTAPPDAKATNKEKKEKLLLALCLRCAGLWRKYAIKWEDIDDLKKVALGGGKGVKRRIDEELLRELVAANEAAQALNQEAAQAAASQDAVEPAKKRAKLDKDGVADAPKRKEKPPPPPPKEPTPPPPPIIPAEPTWRELPCAVCKSVGDTVACQHCKLTVHRRCFGLREIENGKAAGEVKWSCEQCQNDRNPVVSTEYSCCLCLTEETQIDLVEPPRISHRKKNDREKEKERMEKELADAMRAEYRANQLAANRPPGPREPLKCTTGNNWVHVYCAVWAPEIRFSNAKTLQAAEGFQLIPQARFEAVCKLCKNKDHQNRVRDNAGACINCFQCNASFHASCAFEAGYQFGFDVQPVKASRKDQSTATLGAETGSLTAIVMCKEHIVKTIVHPINEVVDETGTTALQVFVEKYKQADLTLTGTVRKAQLAQQTKEKGQQSATAAQLANRRESGATSIAAAVKRGARASIVADPRSNAENSAMDFSKILDTAPRTCAECKVDVTPRWHEVNRHQADEAARLRQIHKRATSGENDDGDRAINGEHQRSSNSAEKGFSQNYHNSRPNGRPLTGDANGSVRNGDDALVNESQGRSFSASIPTDRVKREGEDMHNDWLCHKCFLQKRRTETPPADDAPEAHKNEVGRSIKPVTVSSIEQQFRLWDEPPLPPPMSMSMRQSLPPVNGMNSWPGPGYAPSYGQHPTQTAPPPPPAHHHGPPPPPAHYGQQPNGYHPGPPAPPPPQHMPSHHHPGATPPMMVERHSNFNYQHAPSGPPQYTPTHQHHRPPPLPLFGHGSPPMTNGMHSPHGPPPNHQGPLHSPGFPPPPQQHPRDAPHPSMPPLSHRSEQPQPPYLSPIGAPIHSRPDSYHSQASRPPGSLPSLPPPSHLQVDPTLMSPPAPMANGTSHHGPPPPPHTVSHGPPQHHSAPPPPPPVTPRNNTNHGNGGGASNNPSLANLLS